MTTGCTNIVRDGCTRILLSNWSPRFYRAMDFLAANQRAIEEAVYKRMADPLNADVELIFCDTTSLHFEVDDEDEPRDRPGAGGREVQVLQARLVEERPRRRPAARGESRSGTALIRAARAWRNRPGLDPGCQDAD